MALEKTMVMVVDDDAFVRDLLFDILTAGGYAVKTAENGVDALNQYEKAHPDLFISDMNMPELDGIGLIRTLRERECDTPVVMLTVNDQVSVALEAIRSGADDYLMKDENIQETVLHAVSRALEKYHLKQQNLRLMEDLEAKNQALEESNHELVALNQQKNKFLGIAAHDVRGPIGGIIGLSDMLLDPEMGKLTDEQAECLAMIHSTSKDILTLINDLLDVSMIESGKLEIDLQPGNLEMLIEERIKLMKSSADKKRIEIHSAFEEIPFFYFAPNRIAQVIDNLMTNAIKFSPWEAHIHVGLKASDDLAVVSVRDEGPGISEEDQEKLFGTFQRLSAQPTGGEKSTGLGLAIVKKIIDAHQGEIGVSSVPGEGSTFFFSIPLSLETD